MGGHRRVVVTTGGKNPRARDRIGREPRGQASQISETKRGRAGHGSAPSLHVQLVSENNTEFSVTGIQGEAELQRQTSWIRRNGVLRACFPSAFSFKGRSTGLSDTGPLF